jgi:hypothetical protein
MRSGTPSTRFIFEREQQTALGHKHFKFSVCKMIIVITFISLLLLSLFVSDGIRALHKLMRLILLELLN